MNTEEQKYLVLSLLKSDPKLLSEVGREFFSDQETKKIAYAPRSKTQPVNFRLEEHFLNKLKNLQLEKNVGSLTEVLKLLLYLGWERYELHLSEEEQDKLWKGGNQ